MKSQFERRVRRALDDRNPELASFYARKLVALEDTPAFRTTLAETYFAQNQPRRCYFVLKPLLENGDPSINVVSLAATCLFKENELDDAKELLEPFLRRRLDDCDPSR